MVYHWLSLGPLVPHTHLKANTKRVGWISFLLFPGASWNPITMPRMSEWKNKWVNEARRGVVKELQISGSSVALKLLVAQPARAGLPLPEHWKYGPISQDGNTEDIHWVGEWSANAAPLFPFLAAPLRSPGIHHQEVQVEELGQWSWGFHQWLWPEFPHPLYVLPRVGWGQTVGRRSPWVSGCKWDVIQLSHRVWRGFPWKIFPVVSEPERLTRITLRDEMGLNWVVTPGFWAVALGRLPC